MNHTDYTTDTNPEVDRYIRGLMNEAEREVFERRMAADEALAAEVAEFRAIAEAAADDARRRALMARWDGAGDDASTAVTPAPDTSRRGGMWWKIALPLISAAAVAAVIITVGRPVDNASPASPAMPSQSSTMVTTSSVADTFDTDTVRIEKF